MNAALLLICPLIPGSVLLEPGSPAAVGWGGVSDESCQRSVGVAPPVSRIGFESFLPSEIRTRRDTLDIVSLGLKPV